MTKKSTSKSKQEPTAAFEMITVEIAEKLLEKNPNRPYIDSNVNNLTTAMKDNNFHVTGESMIIGVSGNLLNGQHRLMAICLSKKPQKILVARNISDEAFSFMDTGRNRRASDVLGIEGIKNPTHIATMIRFIIHFGNGRFSTSVKGANKKANITNSEVLDFAIKNHESLVASYPYGINKENTVFYATTLSALHFIFKKINESDANDFCYQVSKGENLKKGDPVYVLRQTLIQDIRSRKKIDKLEKLALVCKAWNLYRGKKSCSILSWNKTREEFPKPI